MILSLDPLSEVPLFAQLHDQILRAYARGELKPGTQLASVRALAADFGINPATVKKAYDQLKAEGIVQTSRRSGSVLITPTTPRGEQREQTLTELTNVLAKAHCQGLSHREITELVSEILTSFSPLPATEPAATSPDKNDLPHSKATLTKSGV